MSTNITVNETTMKIDLDGRLDALTAPELDAELQNYPLSQLTEIVLDAAKLVYISSAGLRTLFHAYKGLKMGGTLRVVNANPITKEVFRVTGFENVYTIE